MRRGRHGLVTTSTNPTATWAAVFACALGNDVNGLLPGSIAVGRSRPMPGFRMAVSTSATAHPSSQAARSHRRRRHSSQIATAMRTGTITTPAPIDTLSPITEERVSEAAGVNSAAGSFGLSFGLAFAGAIMLATLSFLFTDMAENSDVLAPDQQEQVANALEDDAEVMSNTKLDAQLEGQPQEVQDEIIRINTDARPRALQVALLVPIAAGLIGLGNAFRMRRLPDPIPSGASEGMLFD